MIIEYGVYRKPKQRGDKIIRWVAWFRTPNNKWVRVGEYSTKKELLKDVGGKSDN